VPSSKWIAPFTVNDPGSAGCRHHGRCGSGEPVGHGWSHGTTKQSTAVAVPSSRHQPPPPAPSGTWSSVTGIGTWQGIAASCTNISSVRRFGRQASSVLSTGSCSLQPTQRNGPESHPESFRFAISCPVGNEIGSLPR
jgi:hypothetical protein